MKKLLVALVAAVALVSFAGISFAADKAQEIKASGMIKSVDMKKGTLVLRAFLHDDARPHEALVHEVAEVRPVED